MEIRLGESIRKLRKQAGLTQEQLAEALFVSVSAVHKWESNKAAPELETLVEIAEKYYPGTLKILKNKLVNTVTKEEEKGLNSKEMKVFNELKNILLITNEIYNDDKITNAVRIASNRNPKADHNALVKAAYNHLKRHRSDARYLSKSNIDIDTERELILSTKTNLE